MKHPTKHASNSRPASATRWLGPALAVLGLGGRPAGQLPGPQDGRIEEARATLEKWVETRRILSQERRDWALGHETLEGRIAVVQGEIDALRRKLGEAHESLGDADAKRAELERESQRLRAASQTLGARVLVLEARTKELLARLPDPIRERVKPLSQRLPEDPAATTLSTAERFQNVVGILNEVDKFNRELTLTSEVRTLPDGSAAEVTTLYVGIGHGYYVSANGRIAGVGTAGPGGWSWTPASELAPEIAAAVAIQKNERVAAYVRLPVEIR